MTTDNTVLSAPAPTNAEVVQPDQNVNTTTEGTGAPDQTAGQTEEERASEAGRQLAQHRKRNQENAFARVQRRQEELERTNAQLMQTLIERTRPQQSQPSGPQPGSEPSRDQFDSYDAFIEARAEWKAEQAVVRRLQGVAQEAQRVQHAQSEQQVVAAHVDRVQKFSKTVPDFDAVIDAASDVPLSDATSLAIKNMADGPRLLYEIAKNPAIADELSRLPPPAQYVYLGQMSAALRGRALQVSKAPAPGSPVGSRTGATPDVKAMTRDQYYEHITKGTGRKR